MLSLDMNISPSQELREVIHRFLWSQICLATSESTYGIFRIARLVNYWETVIATETCLVAVACTVQYADTPMHSRKQIFTRSQCEPS